VGMPLTSRAEWTADMARALPDDGNRYEVLDGELFVTPAPSADHQELIAVLRDTLSAYVRGHSLGHLFFSPADIEFSAKRLLQPDLFVAPLVNGQRPRNWTQISSLVLAVEVLSPSTEFADRNRKRHIYMDSDVAEYWIVSPAARVIERFRKGERTSEVAAEVLEWQPAATIPPLTVDVVAYFDSVLGAR
jgi:Uma2 family endonuclease